MPTRSSTMIAAKGRPPRGERALAQLEDCDWIALLDADDAWEPGKLAAQREAIERHPDAVLCFGRATRGRR